MLAVRVEFGTPGAGQAVNLFCGRGRRKFDEQQNKYG
jgi:hypothetical protein